MSEGADTPNRTRREEAAYFSSPSRRPAVDRSSETPDVTFCPSSLSCIQQPVQRLQVPRATVTYEDIKSESSPVASPKVPPRFSVFSSTSRKKKREKKINFPQRVSLRPISSGIRVHVLSSSLRLGVFVVFWFLYHHLLNIKHPLKWPFQTLAP